MNKIPVDFFIEIVQDSTVKLSTGTLLEILELNEFRCKLLPPQ